MEKQIEMNIFRVVWVLISFGLFFAGIFQHDWFMLVGGFLMNFSDIEIVHWQGKKYINK